MVLDSMRGPADPFITPVAKKLKNVNPNTISWIGLLLAVGSGIAFAFSKQYTYLLIVGAVLVIVSGYFDTLDGKVAKLFNKCSKRGDYLDHVFDRYADIFMIGGIAVCGWCNIYIGLLAIIGTLLTSYMGTQAQAVGAPRLYSGLLGRADRVVLTTIFPIIQFIFVYVANGDFAVFNFTLFGMAVTISWLDIMLIYFAVVGNITAIQRAIITWNNMAKME